MLSIRYQEDGKELRRFARLLQKSDWILVFERMTSQGVPWQDGAVNGRREIIVLQAGEVEMTALHKDAFYGHWVPKQELSAAHWGIMERPTGGDPWELIEKLGEADVQT